MFGGGIIPADGIPELLDLGVAGIFTPGAPGRAITGWVHAGMGRPVAARRVTGRPAPGSPHRWRRGKEGAGRPLADECRRPRGCQCVGGQLPVRSAETGPERRT
ncbi:hypothetical protein GCM10010240_67130 [Streptomyces griseoviridis]|nr:hypothetical protein GCM10010240_67130 [Streptomyces griseoviridis]